MHHHYLSAIVFLLCMAIAFGTGWLMASIGRFHEESFVAGMKVGMARQHYEAKAARTGRHAADLLDEDIADCR